MKKILILVFMLVFVNYSVSKAETSVPDFEIGDFVMSKFDCKQGIFEVGQVTSRVIFGKYFEVRYPDKDGKKDIRLYNSPYLLVRENEGVCKRPSN